MDPIKFNLFSNITGTQKIDPTVQEPPKQPSPNNTQPVAPVEETPDEEGAIDMENMSLNFDDNLKDLINKK